jgi:CRP-like cAMP-binding protein
MVTLRQFKPGEVIIKEDDVGETAYIIEQGRVEATKEKAGKKAHLGYMEAGEIFGEMSMIDDKPRSATVTAVEETTLKEIHRDDFLDILKSDQDAAIKLLKVFFNRLRELDVQILHLQTATGEAEALSGIEFPTLTIRSAIEISLQGLTPHAAQTLPENPYRIREFPFRIGRKSNDPFAHNDLTIPDSIPYQISRHHIIIIVEKNLIGVMDRGSTLGAMVDGKRFGGSLKDPGPLFFKGDTGVLVLGTDDSPFRYRVVIHSTPG